MRASVKAMFGFPVVHELPSQVKPRGYAYRHYDERGTLLYIGSTKDLTGRTGNHAKNSPWGRLITHVVAEPYARLREAREVERNAIREEKPLHNVKHNRGVRRRTSPSKCGSFTIRFSKPMTNDLRRRARAKDWSINRTVCNLVARALEEETRATGRRASR